MVAQGFVSQCVLVLLLTVYIMSTFSVDKDANKSLGASELSFYVVFCDMIWHGIDKDIGL